MNGPAKRARLLLRPKHNEKINLNVEREQSDRLRDDLAVLFFGIKALYFIDNNDFPLYDETKRQCIPVNCIGVSCYMV